MVDEREHEIFTAAMSSEHTVNSPIGWKLDANKNRHLDWNEIMLARQSYALGREVELEQAQPPFAVRTALDETLDLNGNGRVEQGEIDEFVAVFAADGPVEDVPRRIMELFDHNRNGIIQPH
ncbi:MAG: EF-hand domain-containing protein [Spirochaetota bacterium]|nr:EF-hand domain-containing protein [Spirochaetota bacterium]